MRARMGNEENDDDRQSRRGIYSTIGKNGDDKCGPRIVYIYMYIYTNILFYLLNGACKKVLSDRYTTCVVYTFYRL